MTEPLTRILYVEDEPDIRDIAKLSLEIVGGFTVHPCESGSEALASVESVNPQLILLDVMMPGMNGPSTFKALRQMPCAQNIPVILMTAKVQPHEVQSYIAMGALGVISKPFDPMGLPATIQQLWRDVGIN